MDQEFHTQHVALLFDTTPDVHVCTPISIVVYLDVLPLCNDLKCHYRTIEYFQDISEALHSVIVNGAIFASARVIIVTL